MNDDPTVGATLVAWFTKAKEPAKSGWYPVVYDSGHQAFRLWENGAWWGFSAHEEWDLRPNDSFLYWGDMGVVLPSLVRQVPAEGTA